MVAVNSPRNRKELNRTECFYCKQTYYIVVALNARNANIFNPIRQTKQLRNVLVAYKERNENYKADNVSIRRHQSFLPTVMHK